MNGQRAPAAIGITTTSRKPSHAKAAGVHLLAARGTIEHAHWGDDERVRVVEIRRGARPPSRFPCPARSSARGASRAASARHRSDPAVHGIPVRAGREVADHDGRLRVRTRASGSRLGRARTRQSRGRDPHRDPHRGALGGAVSGRAGRAVARISLGTRSPDHQVARRRLDRWCAALFIPFPTGYIALVGSVVASWWLFGTVIRRRGDVSLLELWPGIAAAMLTLAFAQGRTYALPASYFRFDPAEGATADGWYVQLGRPDDFAFLRPCRGPPVLAVPRRGRRRHRRGSRASATVPSNAGGLPARRRRDPPRDPLRLPCSSRYRSAQQLDRSLQES
jgi:hypothetical protein